MEVIFRIINFILLFGLLGFFCRKMIRNIFMVRKKRLEQDLSDADDGRKKAEELSSHLQKIKEDTEKKKRSIQSKTDKNAASILNRSKDRSKAEAYEIVRRAKEDEPYLRDQMLRRIELDVIEDIGRATADYLKEHPEFSEEKKAGVFRCSLSQNEEDTFCCIFSKKVLYNGP